MSKLILARLNMLLATFRSKYKKWPDRLVVSLDIFDKIKESTHYSNVAPQRSNGTIMDLEIFLKHKNNTDYMAVSAVITIEEATK